MINIPCYLSVAFQCRIQLQTKMEYSKTIMMVIFIIAVIKIPSLELKEKFVCSFIASMAVCFSNH